MFLVGSTNSRRGRHKFAAARKQEDYSHFPKVQDLFLGAQKNQSVTERQTPWDVTQMWNVKKQSTWANFNKMNQETDS